MAPPLRFRRHRPTTDAERADARRRRCGEAKRRACAAPGV
jgi:hypothetical protein